MKKAIGILAMVVVLSASYAMAYRAAQPKGAPAGQVRATLLDAADALQRGHAGEAMRAVSSDYKDSTGTNRDRLYFLAREAARNHAYWDVVVEDLKTSVQGDEATVQMVIGLHRTEGGSVTRHTINLRMRREEARAFVVVPTTRWRIVSADDLPTEDSAFGY